jgi:multiple sugar transport system permease protein
MATYNVSGIKRRPRRRQEELTGWLMTAPALFLLTIFMLAPALISVGPAFTDQRLGLSPLSTRFVGLGNFTRLFTDAVFLQVLENNVAFTLVVVPL